MKHALNCMLLTLLLMIVGTRNVWGEEKTYKLINSTTDLVPGDKYIIASMASGSGAIMKKYISGGNCGMVSATSNNGVISTSSTDIAELELIKPGVYDNFQFFDGTNYYTATNTTSNNTLKANNYSDDAYNSFTITFSSNAAVIKCTGKTSRNIIRWNSNSSIFSCYSSGQQPVYLYKEVVVAKYSVHISNDIVNGTVTATPCENVEAEKEVTLSNTPSEGYVLGSYTVKDASEINITVTDGKFTMPSSDVTVSATFTELPTHTVTWSVNGTTTLAPYYEGQTITFNTPAISSDKPFVGWTSEQITGTTSETPTDLKGAGETTVMGNEDMTYYAVFADPYPYGAVYKLVDAPRDGHDYIFAAQNKKGDHYAMSTNANNGELVAISERDGEVLIENNSSQTDVWHATVSGSTVKLQNASTDEYLKIANNAISMSTSVQSLKWDSDTGLNANGYYVHNSGTKIFSTNTTGSPTNRVYAYEKYTHTNYSTSLSGIVSISATLENDKYKVGDALDLSTLLITVNYEDGSHAYVSTGYKSSIANGTALTTSDTQITITYNSKSTIIHIYVLALDKIEITTDPTKMNYQEGELFDKSGMVVEATWGTDDKTIKEDITDYTWSPETELSVGPQTITLSYTHQTTTKTTTLNVTVTEKPSYTVTISETENGTITVKNGKNTISSGSSVKDGTTLSITVTPADGYKLISWTAEDNNTGSPHTYTESGDYTISGSNVTFSATFSEITTGSSSTWILTPLSELTADDVFLIVDKTSGTALSQKNETKSVPDAVAVELNEDKTIVTLEDATNLTWNVDGNATDGYTFYVESNKTKWLYSTDANNGTGIGGNENKLFTEYSDDTYSGLAIQIGNVTRYLGVYNNQDWRCYKIGTDGKIINVSSTQIGFYRRAEMYTVTIDEPVGNGTISVKNGTLEITSGTKVADGTELKVTATPESDDYKVKSLTATDAEGEHRLVSGNVYTINGSNVTFSVEFAEKQFFTITFVMNGHDDEDDKTLVTSQKEGEYMVIPTVPDYRGKVHFGWVSEEITDSQEYPALANVNGKSRVVDNATYYAVYATRKVNESEGAGTSVDENSFVNGNYYILDTYQATEQPINYYAMTGAPVNNKVTATVISEAITANDDGTVTLDEENEVVNALMVYNITKDTENDGYTIKNVAHNKLVAASASSNALNITNKRLWSMDWEESGNKATFLNTYSEKDKNGNSVVKDACLMLMATNWDSKAQQQSVENAQMFKDYLVSHRDNSGEKVACYGSGYLYLIPAKYSYFDFITDFVDIDITVSAYDYTTYSSDKAYKMPTGLTGRTVYPRRHTDAGYNLYVPATYPEGSFVPVGESLLLQGTANETYTLMQWGVPKDPKVKGSENCLYGEYGSKEASGYKTTYATGGGENADESDKYYYYKLTTKTVNGTKNFGWYWGVEEGKPFYMSRNDRAYLVLPKEVGNNIKGWIYDTEEEEIETGIDSVTTERTDDIYDLSGRRIKGKLSHGIYIMDGKKYMVK